MRRQITPAPTNRQCSLPKLLKNTQVFDPQKAFCVSLSSLYRNLHNDF